MARGTNEEIALECTVAAILTHAVLDGHAVTPDLAVRRYGEVLQALRNSGGPVDPGPRR